MWQEFAACRGLDPDLFYLGRAKKVGRKPKDWVPSLNPEADDFAEAKAVCRTCPVQTNCLAYALSGKEFGIWGGTSENQRRPLRRLVLDGMDAYEVASQFVDDLVAA